MLYIIYSWSKTKFFLVLLPRALENGNMRMRCKEGYEKLEWASIFRPLTWPLFWVLFYDSPSGPHMWFIYLPLYYVLLVGDHLRRGTREHILSIICMGFPRRIVWRSCILLWYYFMVLFFKGMSTIISLIFFKKINFTHMGYMEFYEKFWVLN